MTELDENALEIIFSSADSDNESFLDYYKTMPWTAIPFDNKKGKKFTIIISNLSFNYLIYTI